MLVLASLAGHMPGNVLLQKAFLASHCLNNNELFMCGGRFRDFATHRKLTYPFNYQPENVKYSFFFFPFKIEFLLNHSYVLLS